MKFFKKLKNLFKRKKCISIPEFLEKIRFIDLVDGKPLQAFKIYISNVPVVDDDNNIYYPIIVYDVESKAKVDAYLSVKDLLKLNKKYEIKEV